MRKSSRMAAVGALAAGLLLAGAGAASADAVANGVATDSPGVLSGNVIQIPVDLDVNACGNSINLVGALNPAFGNRCANGESGPSMGDHDGWLHHHLWWHHDDDAVTSSDHDHDGDCH